MKTFLTSTFVLGLAFSTQSFAQTQTSLPYGACINTDLSATLVSGSDTAQITYTPIPSNQNRREFTFTTGSTDASGHVIPAQTIYKKIATLADGTLKNATLTITQPSLTDFMTCTLEIVLVDQTPTATSQTTDIVYHNPSDDTIGSIMVDEITDGPLFHYYHRRRHRDDDNQNSTSGISASGSTTSGSTTGSYAPTSAPTSNVAVKAVTNFRSAQTTSADGTVYLVSLYQDSCGPCDLFENEIVIRLKKAFQNEYLSGKLVFVRRKETKSINPLSDDEMVVLGLPVGVGFSTPLNYISYNNPIAKPVHNTIPFVRYEYNTEKRFAVYDDYRKSIQMALAHAPNEQP